MATLVSLLYTYISTELCTAAEPLESAREFTSAPASAFCSLPDYMHDVVLQVV